MSARNYTTIVKGMEVIKWVKQGDTVTTYLASTKPLVQYIKSGSTTPTPDWTVVTNQPIIYPVVRTSLLDTVVSVTEGSDEWTYNNAKIQFNESGLSTNFEGAFQKVNHTSGDITNPGLKIIKNLASSKNNNNDVIGFIGATDPGGYSAKIEANIDIKIEEVVGEPYIAYIDVTDGGVIDSNTAEIILTAHIIKGSSEITQGVMYAWKKRSAVGTWVDAGSTAKTLTVTEPMIDTQETFKCEYTIDGKVVATATCKVYDETDPYVVVLGRDTATPEITTYQTAINYTPRVVRRSTPDQAIDGMTFGFHLFKSDGTNLTFTNTPTSTSCKVVYDDMKKANGDVTLEVVATK